MHPDKLAQKGQAVTAADRDRFTKMRHAYEVLSDPRRRETYDAIGERGMKWVEEPLSIDPSELAHNFATSSVYDRSKIFGIFLLAYVAVFLLPILVCVMADGNMGSGAKWTAVLTPLWIWDVILLFYHSRVIMMGPIKRPDHIPEEEWVDPLPMWKRVLAMVRFGLLVLFELLVSLQLDGFIRLPWVVVFVPIFLWEFIALRKKVMLANMNIVTHEELELAIGKKFTECTPSEKEDVHRRYIVVPNKEGSIYEAACRLKQEAVGDIIRILTRMIFSVLLVLNLQLDLDWSWWLIFVPIYVMAFCICGAAFRRFTEAQAEAALKDPDTFGGGNNGEDPETAYAKMDESKAQPISDEEREELKAKIMHSAYKAVGTCFSQCFFLFLTCLLIAKMEGAGYSYMWIISPFLTFGGIILCCLACTIFCISEVDENAGIAEFDSTVDQAAAAAYGTPDPSNVYQPPNQQRQDQQSTAPFTAECRTPVESSWDPEKGQVWTPEETKEAPKLTEDEPTTTIQASPSDENKETDAAPPTPSFDLD